jgi:deazaflavin-dependent oxidoreductase (nitroreductase family)
VVVMIVMRDYVDAGAFRRLVRRTAATRPMTWVYIRIQQPIDHVINRLTWGRTTASELLSGIPVVMLTTTGARTGKPRIVPVVGIADGDRLAVIASNYGRPGNPGWCHNLRADPAATVGVDGVQRRVRARELTGAERAQAFRRAAAMHPGFVVYQNRAATRSIPVFSLEPAVDGRSGAG